MTLIMRRELIKMILRNAEGMVNFMNTCKRCNVPLTFPGIDFNGEGICTFCQIHTEKPKIVRSPKGRDLLFQRIKEGECNDYDCIVPISGGKDSSFILYYISRILGLKPLAVCVDSGFMHTDARYNIENLCSKMNVDLVIHKCKVRIKHVRNALKIAELSGVDIGFCGGCETDIRSTIVNQARKHNVKTIIYGSTDYENKYDTFLEGGETFREKYDTARKRELHFKNFIRSYYIGYLKPILKAKRSLINRITAVVHLFAYIINRIGANLEVRMPGGMKALIPNTVVHLDKYKLNVIYFFDYIQYDPIRQIAELKEKVQWKASEGHESRMDCTLHPIIAYRHLQETGMTSDGFTASVLVRYGLMDRQEAIDQEQIRQKYALENTHAILQKLGIKSLF